MSERYYLAIDVEANGENASHSSVIAVGLVLGCATDGHIVDELQLCIRPMPGEQPSKSCTEKFWRHHPDVLREITENAISAPTAVKMLTEWLRAIAKRYSEIVILTDAPQMDIARLDILLYRLDPKFGSVCYMGGDRYTHVKNPRDALDMGRQLMGHAAVDPALHAWRAHWESPPHDHRPWNDARRLFYDMLFVDSLALTRQ